MVAGINTNEPEYATLEEVAIALRNQDGNIGAAARELGVQRGNLKKRIDKYPELQELMTELRDDMIDYAESNVFRDVKAGDGTASRFVLQTIGKDRGWVTRQENTNKDPIQITVRTFSDRPNENHD